MNEREIQDNIGTMKVNYQIQYYISNPCGGRPLIWPYLSSGLSDICKIVYENAKFDHSDGRMLQICFENSKWQTTAILKIVISPHFSEIIRCCNNEIL